MFTKYQVIEGSSLSCLGSSNVGTIKMFLKVQKHVHVHAHSSAHTHTPCPSFPTARVVAC